MAAAMVIRRVSVHMSDVRRCVMRTNRRWSGVRETEEVAMWRKVVKYRTVYTRARHSKEEKQLNKKEIRGILSYDLSRRATIGQQDKLQTKNIRTAKKSVEEKVLDQIDRMKNERGAQISGKERNDDSLYDAVMVNFYHFANIQFPEELVQELREQCESECLLGRVLIAREGINGGLVGAPHSIDNVIGWMSQHKELAGFRWSTSRVARPGLENSPFHRLQIRLKKEIITMGVSLQADDSNEHNEMEDGGTNLLMSQLGEHVPPHLWDELISQDDVILIDVRNQYEYKCGTFQNAINPKTEQFSDFPKFVEDNLDPISDKRVAMFCTGGIRCEKASAYMKQKGFKNVYQLEGGILNYIASTPPEKTSWQGDCFVFDNRVAVPHSDPADSKSGRESRIVAVCHGCREPLFADDIIDKEKYMEGVFCPYCVDKINAKQLQRRVSRQQNLSLFGQRLGALRKETFNKNLMQNFKEVGRSEGITNSLQQTDSQ